MAVPQRLFWACVLVFLVGTASAGCGGRLSDQQYQTQIDKVQKLRIETLAGLPQTDLGDVKFFATAQQRLASASEQLDNLQPPRHVQAAHGLYVDALAGMARVMGEFADCARLQQRQPERGVDCRRKIDQLELDKVQNDFNEAETIYRQEGIHLKSAPGGTTLPGG